TFRLLNLASPSATTPEPSKAAPGISDLLTDEELISQICLGNREALAHIFRRYSKLVRSVSIRILRDAGEADDLLQDIFVFIYRKSYIFDRGKSTARSWIVQMTYHRAIDRRRELQARHFYSQVSLGGGVEVMDQSAENPGTALSLSEVVGN